jgi:hypothetical protein
MTRPRLLVVVLLIVTCQSAAIAAASQDTGTPEAIVERYFRAVAEGSFGEAAALMDPAGLERLKDMLVPVLVEASAAGNRAPLTLLDGVGTAEAAENLSGPAFFAAFMRGLARLNPAFAQAFRSVTGTVIGSVPEGDATRHVVCRSTARAGDIALTKMTVVTLHRVGDDWKVALSGEIEGIVEAIRKGIASRKPPA